ncbi:hypothetical protein FNAPI_3499 [Fusarium napiforme]|uniref:Uncharacterized protein n=1 Tax=Fusarium napiforme TaxID=42672 RepID=A0A8H5JV89_9HYPO|nr:hypothetical protein FNAPI_3499 [Fusarium napiforme]
MASRRRNSNMPFFRNSHNNRLRSQYLEKKMEKVMTQGTQLHFKCQSKLTPVLLGASALAAAPQGRSRLPTRDQHSIPNGSSFLGTFFASETRGAEDLNDVQCMKLPCGEFERHREQDPAKKRALCREPVQFGDRLKKLKNNKGELKQKASNSWTSSTPGCPKKVIRSWLFLDKHSSQTRGRSVHHQECDKLFDPKSLWRLAGVVILIIPKGHQETAYAAVLHHGYKIEFILRYFDRDQVQPWYEVDVIEWCQQMMATFTADRAQTKGAWPLRAYRPSAVHATQGLLQQWTPLPPGTKSPEEEFQEKSKEDNAEDWTEHADLLKPGMNASQFTSIIKNPQALCSEGVEDMETCTGRTPSIPLSLYKLQGKPEKESHEPKQSEPPKPSLETSHRGRCYAQIVEVCAAALRQSPPDLTNSDTLFTCTERAGLIKLGEATGDKAGNKVRHYKIESKMRNKVIGRDLEHMLLLDDLQSAIKQQKDLLTRLQPPSRQIGLSLTIAKTSRSRFAKGWSTPERLKDQETTTTNTGFSVLIQGLIKRPPPNPYPQNLTAKRFSFTQHYKLHDAWTAYILAVTVRWR